MLSRWRAPKALTPTALAFVSFCFIAGGCSATNTSAPEGRSATSTDTSSSTDKSGSAGTSAPMQASPTVTTAPAPATQDSAAPASAAFEPQEDSNPSGAPILTGSEVLAGRQYSDLAGKRVGLIAHRPSVVNGERLADLLREAPDVDLVALFAPEHGLFGLADAGESVGDGTDASTGVEVFSLYGQSRSPTPNSLQDLDVLVYDLQDVGTRFFTYISTLGLAMQSAARAGVSFMVLDRPNPLGGRFQGPLLAPGLESFIGQYRVPSAYGLTAGELALMIKEHSLLPGLESLDLQVVPVQGWTRGQRWADTERQWIRPSPNLPTIDGMLLYPGIVLFEATSISEGRGTAEPFEVIGASWLDADALAASMNARAIPGVAFERIVFTPQVIIGAAQNPRFEGEELGGVKILVQDRSAVSGVEVGLHLLAEVIQQGDAVGRSPQEIIDRPDVFDRLAGTTSVRQALENGGSVENLLASFAADHQNFAEKIRPFLLYE